MINLTIRSFSLFLAYLCFTVINASCEKEYSYESGPIIAPPEIARYTLEGDPGTCSNFIAIGNYISGEALRITNYVEVMVNVTAIGSYSINTDTIEGISFSKSGNFTVTGIQKVILKGSGTPSTSRILTFNINTGTSGCTFTVIVLPAGAPATYVLESNPDHKCTNYSISGTCYSGTPLISANTMVVKAYVTVPGNFTISTNPVNGMTFSYTGNFVSLGSQVVVLTGSGTPVNAGTFTFTPQIIGPHPLGGETCTADIDVL